MGQSLQPCCKLLRRFGLGCKGAGKPHHKHRDEPSQAHQSTPKPEHFAVYVHLIGHSSSTPCGSCMLSGIVHGMRPAILDV